MLCVNSLDHFQSFPTKNAATTLEWWWEVWKPSGNYSESFPARWSWGVAGVTGVATRNFSNLGSTWYPGYLERTKHERHPGILSCFPSDFAIFLRKPPGETKSVPSLNFLGEKIHGLFYASLSAVSSKVCWNANFHEFSSPVCCLIIISTPHLCFLTILLYLLVLSREFSGMIHNH